MRFAPINPVLLPFFDIIAMVLIADFCYLFAIVFFDFHCGILRYPISEYADNRLRIGRLFTPQDALAHVLTSLCALRRFAS